ARNSCPARRDPSRRRRGRGVAGRRAVRRARAGGGGGAAARLGRGADAGLDEPGRGGGNARNGAGLLLVAQPRRAVAQGRDLGPGAALDGHPAGLRRRRAAAAGGPVGRRLPHRAAELLLPGASGRRVGGDRGAGRGPGGAVRAV
ncbi:MAG: Phosphoribosyl-AMP cyclohydrolase, partial [uncultured Acetobacteraceae bacterium]